MRVGIVARHNHDRAVRLAGDLAAGLDRAGDTAVVDETTRDALAAADDAAALPDGIPADALADCDLAVSIGGDGTFLFTARGAGTTPVLGVNLGEVGFLNAVDPENALAATRETVERLRDGDGPATMAVPRIEATGEDWTLEPAVNEIAIQGTRRGHGGGLTVTVRVDGAQYTAGHADGFIVATPVGSTAYNLSEGGPLVHHAVDGLVLTDMAGDGLRPPLVVDADSEVTVEVSGPDEAVVVGDGRVSHAVQTPATMTVSRAPAPLRIAEPSLEFFSALAKLD